MSSLKVNIVSSSEEIFSGEASPENISSEEDTMLTFKLLIYAFTVFAFSTTSSMVPTI